MMMMITENTDIAADLQAAGRSERCIKTQRTGRNHHAKGQEAIARSTVTGRLIGSNNHEQEPLVDSVRLPLRHRIPS
jgi:hypothetical protein